MKYHSAHAVSYPAGRAPHGARGLKSITGISGCITWKSRAPHGARGLKYDCHGSGADVVGRAPHGARGLKCEGTVTDEDGNVAPRTGRVD